MKIEDEISVQKLVTDYMCWWDDRVQNRDYPPRLDENATWEIWNVKRKKSVLFRTYKGKGEILSSKATVRVPIVHTTSNFVTRAIDDDHAEVRAYYQTYVRTSGHLLNHGEGRYQVSRVDGEWRLMSINNQYYPCTKVEHTWMRALKVVGFLLAAMTAGLVGGKFF